jgi:hypothetical protein
MDGFVSMEAMLEQMAVLYEVFAAVKTPGQRLGR